jgi:hypothetical protein
MNVSKGMLALLVIGVCLGSGLTALAVSQWSSVSRIYITKPNSVGVEMYWESIVSDQNVSGVCQVIGGDLDESVVVVPLRLTNLGSSDVLLTWSVGTLPEGMSVSLEVNGVAWSGVRTIGRGAYSDVSIIVEDDGTLAVGKHSFDLVIGEA